MSNRPAPNEYTQSRQEFGRHAITVLKANKEIVGGLLSAYATLNDFVNPTKGTQPSGTPSGGTTNETEVAKVLDAYGHDEGHHPYLVYDVLRAIDKLIEFTEERYL
jgi:hypothetical protein